MAETSSGTRSSILQLILVPSIVTLVITILRLVGELQHWTPRLFSSEAGGGGALIGISWLPFIFGPYFAVKLAKSGDGPSGTGKSIGFAVLGFLVMFVGGFIGFAPQPQFPGKLILGLAIAVAAVVLPYKGWPSLVKTLLAYGYAARIPVALIMFFAIQGNWGTHYDAPPPNYAGPTDLIAKWAFIGRMPQLILWPVFTVMVGSLAGTIFSAIARRGKAAVQSAA